MNKYVIVTDKNRGVCCGKLVAWDEEHKRATLHEARMVVAWRGVRGLFELGTNGPRRECRISPALDKAVISDVHAFLGVSEEALAAFRSEPWF